MRTACGVEHGTTHAACIAGGGPAGMLLGYLLARAGLDVVVLEKHGDFLRDFRGDTVHPSTLAVIGELGLLERFLKIPHQRVARLAGVVNGHRVTIADFAHVRTRCRYIAMMPQWDLLNFFATEARAFPSFHLEINAEVTGLIAEDGRVIGVRVADPSGKREIRAALVVAADGRHSTVRRCAALPVHDLGAPIDVLWIRLPKRPGDPSETLGYFDAGRVLVTIDRGEYFQCGLVIPKGGIDALHAGGIRAVREQIAALAPLLRDRVDAIRDWNDVSLLTVRIDRLERWHRPGLLCIGDAAHAMSPMGGVGINLAIQDAVAAANLLAAPLRDGAVSDAQLEAVQRRRMPAVRFTQGLQVFAQERVFGQAPPGAVPSRSLPAPLRLLQMLPLLQAIPAYVVGVGVRPARVRTPNRAG
ncbi:FAD-dependent oxidoreductase [Vulcanimicrobium alpinum]|uniref:FAD-dependent oxidoreductase n=1 Tax=Vulcanimicrobium alpinum TaxID=3016050 RepID=UPI00295E7FF8|nr:FAD-dependent oxidoreductase [Vulcanimicrobium alpinum]